MNGNTDELLETYNKLVKAQELEIERLNKILELKDEIISNYKEMVEKFENLSHSLKSQIYEG